MLKALKEKKMQKMYTVKDEASQTFIKPFCFATDRDAIEGFRNVCNDDDSQYAKFPQDFTLVGLGSYDEQSGTITLLDEKITIARALDLVGKDKVQ